nr:MAG TPA: hypothetical protein [Bacteriophage sp.]
MAKHPALRVAEWFIQYNLMLEYQAGADTLTHFKLQKLLYYAQGSFLAVTGQPLFDDPIEKWTRGPVVKEVYDKVMAHGDINDLLADAWTFSDFSQEEKDLLQEVFEVFGQYSTWKLYDMMCGEAPWRETTRGEEIPLDKMRDFFVKEYLAEN